MAKNTFERRIEISDKASLKRLMEVMSSEPPEKPISNHPFSKMDRDRSEELLKQCSLRSPR